MVYDRGETALIIAKTETYFFGTDKYEPSWVDDAYPKITITDPQNNKVVDNQPMIKSSVIGTYYYDYFIKTDDPIGLWNMIIDSSMEENKTIGKSKFNVA